MTRQLSGGARVRVVLAVGLTTAFLVGAMSACTGEAETVPVATSTLVATASPASVGEPSPTQAAPTAESAATRMLTSTEEPSPTPTVEAESVIDATATPEPATPVPDVPASCEEGRDLQVYAEGATEQALVTCYECPGMHVDSTGGLASAIPSLTAPEGGAVLFEFEGSGEPTGVELRLYPERGLSASFFRWPEELPPGVEPVDGTRPEPGYVFNYQPDVSPGEYSAVVRVTRDGVFDFFYAVNLTVE